MSSPREIGLCLFLVSAIAALLVADRFDLDLGLEVDLGAEVFGRFRLTIRDRSGDETSLSMR